VTDLFDRKGREQKAEAGLSWKYFDKWPKAPLTTMLSYPNRNPPTEETAVAINKVNPRVPLGRVCLIAIAPRWLIKLSEEKETMYRNHPWQRQATNRSHFSCALISER
jgi:hypothetical protein